MKYISLKMLVFIFIFSTVISHGQVKIDSFQIKSSTLLEDILKIKSVNPKISVIDLAEQANALLQTKGINFDFAFDQSVCQKVLDARQKQKDKTQPVKLNATLKSVDAENAAVSLPDISFEKNECGRCFIQMPVFEFSGKDFITSIQETNIKFFTPSNFIFNEVDLIDNKNPLNIVRKWFTPFRTAPLGISDDLKLLYLELPDKELNELALVIFDNGGFQFYAKSDLDLTAKSAKLTDLPKEMNTPNTAFLSFIIGDKIQTLKYNTSCQ